MRNRPLNRRRPERSGAALVEMALVLPIFVMVTLGIVEFGRAMMVGQIVSNAARETARLGIVDGSTNTGITTFCKDFLHDAINVNQSDVTVTITVTEHPGNPGASNTIENASAKDLVTIKVEVPFDKVSYVAGSYLSGKTLAGISAMRHE